MQTAKTEKQVNAKRAAARAIPGHQTLQEKEAEKRLLIQDQLQAEQDQLKLDELRHLDTDGEMLHYEITFPKTKEKPSPVYGNVNSHRYVIPRGVPSRVPWFVVVHHANNLESVYEPQFAPDGKSAPPKETKQLGEYFQARAINPIPGAELPF